MLQLATARDKWAWPPNEHFSDSIEHMTTDKELLAAPDGYADWAIAFKPEHAGQLNFYLAAVDAQIKAPDDNPAIGLLLCKQHNRLVADYALSGMTKPMGVAQYRLLGDLPEDLGKILPSIAAIEAELSDQLPPPTIDGGEPGTAPGSQQKSGPR